MEENQSSPKKVENQPNLKGEIKGEILKGVLDYIKDEEGEKGFEKLQKELKDKNFLIKPQEIKKSFWYPISWHLNLLLVIKKIFSFSDEDIFKMGKAVAKEPFFLTKIAAPPFICFEKKAEISSQKLWQGYFFKKESENNKAGGERKYYLVRLENLEIHPLFCKFLEGYIAGLSSYFVKSDKINIKETACPFKGDFYHEFTIWW